MNIITFKKVTKKFLNGKIVANDEISFDIKKGEIHAIAGENGAGKSTLLSMLFGLYPPDSGEILVRNKVIKYRSAAEAMKDGLGMVQQHFQLVERFSVGQNILFGKEKTKYGLVNNKTEFAKIDKLANDYQFGINSRLKVANLSVGQKQKTEILKLLYSDVEIFIFDEPTAMLIPQEIDHLLAVMKELKKQGKTIILITHKLHEIKAVADRVSVIRKGKYIGQILKKDLNADKLSELMVGQKIKPTKKVKVTLGNKIMSVKNLSVKSNGLEKLKNISFDIHQGEILAIAGVEGNGQTELANAILGLQKAHQGSITFFPNANEDNNKQEILLHKLKISKRNELIASIPEDRHKYGMVLDMKIYENMALKNFWTKYSFYGLLNRLKMKEDGIKIINSYDVRGTNEGMALSRSLSGGNQQKAVVGREIEANRDLIIIFQGTRGLDINAIEYIHQNIIKTAQNKKAILLISYDIDEIIKLADRILVFNNGSITGELDRAKMTYQKLGKFMSSRKEELHV